MGSLIHMETEKVRLAALRLAKTAETMAVAAQALRRQLGSLPWDGAGREAFIARSQQVLQHIERQAEEGLRLSRRLRVEVDEWLAADGRGGSEFLAKARRMYPGGLALLPAAQVLGAATVAAGGVYAPGYESMSWNGRLAEEVRLREDLAACRERLANMRSEEAVRSELEAVESQLAELEARYAEAQRKAEAWYNQVLPDWPLQGDEDGLPWRVRADDFEEQAAGYEAELQALRARQQALQAELQGRAQAEAQLMELQARQVALQQVIDRGVPADGPTKPDWLRKQLGGCTLYVAEKRDVYSFPNARGDPGHPGNACQWNEQARQAGYDVGSRPVPGSIMVLEADGGKDNGIMNVSNGDGHVAYVEKVQRVEGGYRVTISQANTKYVGDSFQRGVYVGENTMTVTVRDGQTAASFIYDK